MAARAPRSSPSPRQSLRGNLRDSLQRQVSWADEASPLARRGSPSPLRPKRISWAGDASPKDVLTKAVREEPAAEEPEAPSAGKTELVLGLAAEMLAADSPRGAVDATLCDGSNVLECLRDGHGAPAYVAGASGEAQVRSSMNTPQFPWSCAQLAYDTEENDGSEPVTMCVGQGVSFTLGGNDVIWEDNQWVEARSCNVDASGNSIWINDDKNVQKPVADRCYGVVKVRPRAA